LTSGRRGSTTRIHAAEGLRLGVETANENVALVHRAERDHAALAAAVRAGTVPSDLGPAS
jgi:hypothetical protein